MDWQIGNVVQCKSGGPQMVVKAIGGDGIRCEWIDASGKYQFGTFASTSLEAPELPNWVTI